MSGVRMPDHVSPDTGRRLREAGLHHEWQVSDWMVTPDEPGPVLVVDIDEGEPVTKHYCYVVSDCTWLPTTGQLLELLAAKQGSRPETGYADGRWWVSVFGPHAWDYGRGVATEVDHEEHAEALAEAWLRVHEQEAKS